MAGLATGRVSVADIWYSIVGIAEFGDFGTDPTPDFPADFNLSYQGNGSIVQVFEPGGTGSEFFWNTIGPISFSLDSGTANTFLVSYLTRLAGQAAPLVWGLPLTNRSRHSS